MNTHEVSERKDNLNLKIANLTFIKKLIELYSSMLENIGPEEFGSLLEKSDQMLWSELGKELFSEIEIKEIIDAVVILAYEVLASKDKSYEEISNLLNKHKAGESIDSKTMAEAANRVFDASTSTLDKFPEISDILRNLLTSAGKFLAAKVVNGSAIATQFRDEKLVPFFKEVSTCKASTLVLDEHIDTMRAKSTKLEFILKDARRESKKGTA